MTIIKKLYDKDLQLYLDIEKELRLNLTLSKKLFLQKLDKKLIESYQTYHSYISMKRRELNRILALLRKRLNIISIQKYLK